MDEISSDDLYYGLLVHGLFAEKLPPVFTSKPFYDYCLAKTHEFSKKAHGYIYFESIRNVNNLSRPFGIPNPMGYQILCEFLSDNWDKIREHFCVNTANQNYKISRIHIRKYPGERTLFKMNYNKNWKVDGTPEQDLLIGSKYVVKADISNCFPSIYTHSLGWAIVGKEVAKETAKTDRNNDLWYNKLDVLCRNLRSKETHGLMIGPHASNLLSEIILVVIDNSLKAKKYKFLHHIDDYTCYVESHEEGQRFITDLRNELRKFDLALNQKKVSIEQLPFAEEEKWTRQLTYDAMVLLNEDARYSAVDFKKVRAYLDSAIELVKENDNNIAILNYAAKVLAGVNLTNNAKKYCIKTYMHLAILYPYLITYLDECIFDVFDAECEEIKYFSKIIYKNAKRLNNYEAMYYVIYFALKYDFELDCVELDDALDNDSCILKLFIWLYFDKHSHTIEVATLKNHAKSLLNEIDEYWLFVYEILSENELQDEWVALKRAKVSFIDDTKLKNKS